MLVRSKVFHSVINPNTSKESIRNKAKELKCGDYLTREEARKVYNAVVQDTVVKIGEFIGENQFGNVSAKGFRREVGDVVEENIRKAYRVNVTPTYEDLEKEGTCLRCTIL